jgi:gamma-glutamylcyclotransferase (GGCT)/AIG2-like uncharacterized protein YtfP
MLPMEPDGIFVYGPLCAGGRQHVWLERTAPEGSCRAWVPGRLFHLPAGGFPAVVAGPEPESPPPGPGWVAGEFVSYGDEGELYAALADLDQVQDVEGDLFTRHVLPVRLESGLRYTAWVYLFEADRLLKLEREAVELPGGDWTTYLEAADE